MNHLIMKDFRDGATPRMLFNRTPRMTIATIFAMAAHALPDHGTVQFRQYRENITTSVFPYCAGPDVIKNEGLEETHLSYTFFPASRALAIDRIAVQVYVPHESIPREFVLHPEFRGRGTGSAMLASQFSVWEKLDVRSLIVSTHPMGEGFYRKLGFDRVDNLPEMPDYKSGLLMRLNLENPLQKTIFLKALEKAPSLSAQPLPR